MNLKQKIITGLAGLGLLGLLAGAECIYRIGKADGYERGYIDAERAVFKTLVHLSHSYLLKEEEKKYSERLKVIIDLAHELNKNFKYKMVNYNIIDLTDGKDGKIPERVKKNFKYKMVNYTDGKDGKIPERVKK